jgi:hypothetical protein
VVNINETKAASNVKRKEGKTKENLSVNFVKLQRNILGEIHEYNQRSYSVTCHMPGQRGSPKEKKFWEELIAYFLC